MGTQRLAGVVIGVCGLLLVFASLGRVLMFGGIDSYVGPATMALIGVALTWLGLMCIGQRRL